MANFTSRVLPKIRDGIGMVYYALFVVITFPVTIMDASYNR
jgi:hypothetical protein